MAWCITLYSCALVALSFKVLLTTAAPFSPPQKVISVVATTSDGGTATNAVVAHFSPMSTSISQLVSLDASSVATPTRWTLPEMFSDLSPLGINKLAYGSHNIHVVTGIPASASALITTTTSADCAVPTTARSIPRVWRNASSAYRIFYPSGSINPRHSPQGGSDFYAMPGKLPTENAKNVTLEYSVFFPVDFEWVRGGKLPGLYGGHEGCSGGNDARSCFSTRMMWRKGGAGELYLYAPKDKQTVELCNVPPQTVCDAEYGLSIGRGSFHFVAGGWTHVSQTVRLNTPGQQDGGFELFVNGQHIMRRDDVFYRDVPRVGSGEEGDEGGYDAILWPGVSQGINILAPLHPIVFGLDDRAESAILAQKSYFFPDPIVSLHESGSQSSAEEIQIASNTAASRATAILLSSPAATATFPSQVRRTEDNHVVGFSGLFFSTFFGGHEDSWASPKDQYTWFKDFAMSVNE